MKEFWKNLTVKQIVLSITAAVSLTVFLILTAVCSQLSGQLTAQNMADRWAPDGGAAQVSCFFSQQSQVDENTIKSFEHTLDQALLESSITVESPNASARLWADAYSTSGKLNLEGKAGQSEVNVIGVGGDFFLFHPLQLVNGAYFSGSDLMQDHIVIDEDIAWQLFGSNDVVGQQVMINGIPHLVNGVIKRDSGRLNDKAGNGSSTAYVSYETLSKNLAARGQVAAINHYEIVMPNPVDGFAYGMVKDKIGIEETEIEIVENTTRFKLLPMFKVLGNFGMRSMNGKAIIYPYWENIARGYEDIFALILIFRILFLLYPIVLLVILIVYLWKHRKWHFKDVKNFAERKREAHREKSREKSRKKKEKVIDDDDDEEEPWL